MSVFRQFLKDRYVVIPSCFPPEIFSTLLERFEKVEKSLRNPDKVHQRYAVLTLADEYREYLINSPAGEILTGILEDTFIVEHPSANVLYAGANRVLYHKDYPYDRILHYPYDSLVGDYLSIQTVLALDDIKDNGPISIKGEKQDGCFIQDKFTSIEMNKGDMLLFLACQEHSSTPNISGKRRAVILSTAMRWFIKENPNRVRLS